MLSVNDVQEAIITKLKGDLSLTTALGGSDEIREDEWPGPDWTYPATRVAVNSLTPTSEGGCHLSEWSVTFSIFVFTEPIESGGIYTADSSQCSTLMFYIANALFGEYVNSSGNFVAMSSVNITGENPPVPEPPPGGWRGEVLCEMRVKDVS